MVKERIRTSFVQRRAAILSSDGPLPVRWGGRCSQRTTNKKCGRKPNQACAKAPLRPTTPRCTLHKPLCARKQTPACANTHARPMLRRFHNVDMSAARTRGAPQPAGVSGVTVADITTAFSGLLTETLDEYKRALETRDKSEITALKEQVQSLCGVVQALRNELASLNQGGGPATEEVVAANARTEFFSDSYTICLNPPDPKALSKILTIRDAGKQALAFVMKKRMQNLANAVQLPNSPYNLIKALIQFLVMNQKGAQAPPRPVTQRAPATTQRALCTQPAPRGS